jgi:hypothetical protein
MKKIFVFAILTIALVACKNKSADQSAKQAEEFKAFTEKVAQIKMSASTPDDIMKMLELTAVDFMPELVNDPANSDKYLSNDIFAAANVGIYLVDGLYQYSSKEFASGYQSILAAKNLSTKLGLSESFDKLVVDRYNNPNPEIDTLLAKIDETIAASETELKAKDNMRLYTSMIAANYIEKEYILFNIIFKYDVDVPDEYKLILLRQVLYATGEHLKKLPDVIALIESVKKDTDPGTFLNELKAIDALRQQLVFPADKSQLTPDQIFKNQTLLTMFEKIKEVRGSIVAIPASEATK